MKNRADKLLLACAAIVFSAAAFAQQQKPADQFGFPVGAATFPPTEKRAGDGQFFISRHFDTSANWEGGGANGAWCGFNFTRDATHTTKTACESASKAIDGVTYPGRWMFGHTGTDLANDTKGVKDSPIHAIANGVVVDVLPAAQSGGYGNLIRLRHVLPGGAVVYSMYGHMEDQRPQPNASHSFPYGLSVGKEVPRGDVIGYVASMGTGGANHVHFSVYADSPNLSNRPPDYVYYDNGADAPFGWLNHNNSLLDIYDGLLFVDDRSKSWQPGATLECCNIRTPFTVPVSMTSRTMYIENTATGTIASLSDAVSRSWIAAQFSYKADGTWYAFKNAPIDNRVFDPEKDYAITALVTGLRLHGYYPGNHYLDERARQDMRQYANGLGANRAMRETFIAYADDFDPSSYVRQMQFLNWNGAAWEIVYVAHGRAKDNPMHRWVQIHRNGAWSAWTAVSPWFQ